MVCNRTFIAVYMAFPKTLLMVKFYSQVAKQLVVVEWVSLVYSLSNMVEGLTQSA